MSRARRLLTIGDLGPAGIASICERARTMGDRRRTSTEFITGLVFLSPSLRTRTGFATATMRLGGTVIDVAETRFDASMSEPESVQDTLRTVDELCDVVVVRGRLELADMLAHLGLVTPLINGGDDTDHPTQALIDLWTMEQLVGGVDGRSIGLCGDLTMRSVRSLLEVLAEFRPAEVVLIAPKQRSLDAGAIPPALRGAVSVRDVADFSGLDVLYIPGFPPGRGEQAVPAEVRLGYSLCPSTISTLPDSAVVLSPLPIIDEIHPDVLTDPRVQPWATHHHSTAIRMAVLEHSLGG